MSLIKNIKQFSTSSTGLMVIAIGSTLIISVSYHVFMKPEFDRRRRQEAEAMADYIFQHEVKQTKSSREQQRF